VKTCLNNFLKRCENCQRDYDTNHHPNNYDCPNYQETEVMTFIAYEKGYQTLEEKSCRGLKNTDQES